MVAMFYVEWCTVYFSCCVLCRVSYCFCCMLNDVECTAVAVFFCRVYCCFCFMLNGVECTAFAVFYVECTAVSALC